MVNEPLYADHLNIYHYQNLVNGYGLNWARFGAPVEGFTSPLWTFLMIPVNALPVGLNHTSLLMQLLSLLLLALNLLLIRRLMIAHFGCGAKRYWFPAVALTAAYYPLNYCPTRHGIGLTSAPGDHIRLSCAQSTRKKSGPVALLSVFAVAYLVRMDMLLLVFVVLGFIAYRGDFSTRADKSSWLLGFMIFGLTIVSYSLFRWLYFHELLPNTYYLKLTGIPVEIRILRGLQVFVEHFFLPISIPLLLITAATLLFMRSRPKLLLPLLIIGVYFGCSIYVGGDIGEYSGVGANRFVVVAMPMVFVLFNALLNQGLAYLDQRRKPALSRNRPLSRGRPLIIAGALILVLFFNGFFMSSRSFGDEFRKFTAIKRPAYTEHAWFVRKSMELQASLQPASIVATVGAGVPAYFTDFRMVDLLGYNEKTIAGMDAVLSEDFRYYLPGHAKNDIHYILTEYKPDFFFSLHGVPNGFLRSQGYEYNDELEGWQKSSVFSET